MSSLIKHKRVEFSELFYDLVFVYAISRTTALIHHLHGGVIEWEALLSFIFTLILLVNNWMLQTVYTNRYGRNSMLNIVIMFINMALLLLISNMITTEWMGYYNLFCGVVGLLTATIFFQYWMEYHRSSSTQEDKRVIRGFLVLTGFRTIGVWLSALFPVTIGLPIYSITIFVTFLMPLGLRKGETAFEVNVPHLIERISLLVIITFGEMVMGIANFFLVEDFSWRSICYFLMMVSMFMFYFGEFDHAIDEEADTKGLFLIYSHYPIFAGLMIVTVSMSFLTEVEANPIFVVVFLYIGLLLFQWSVIANGRQNKSYLSYDRRYLAMEAGISIVSFLLSLVFASNTDVVTLITTIAIFAMESHFTVFYIRKTKENGTDNWYYL